MNTINIHTANNGYIIEYNFKNYIANNKEELFNIIGQIVIGNYINQRIFNTTFEIKHIGL